MQSTPLIAFDQHAATTVAAVLLPGHRTPALHTLTSDSSTILRFVKRLGRHAEAAAHERAARRLEQSESEPAG